MKKLFDGVAAANLMLSFGLVDKNILTVPPHRVCFHEQGQGVVAEMK